MKTISDILLEMKADAAASHKVTYGNLDSFEERWKSEETEHLIKAREKMNVAMAASEKEAEENKIPEGLHRSKMTTTEKTAFVSEHGHEAFQKLPE